MCTGQQHQSQDEAIELRSPGFATPRVPRVPHVVCSVPHVEWLEDGEARSVRIDTCTGCRHALTSQDGCANCLHTRYHACLPQLSLYLSPVFPKP